MNFVAIYSNRIITKIVINNNCFYSTMTFLRTNALPFRQMYLHNITAVHWSIDYALCLTALFPDGTDRH